MIIALAIELASKAEYELSFYLNLAVAPALSHRLIFSYVWKQFCCTDSGKQIKRLLRVTSFLCSTPFSFDLQSVATRKLKIDCSMSFYTPKDSN